MTASPIPAGKSTVTPYIGVKGAARLLDFVRDAFGAIETGRVENPDGTIGHAEVRVGDSVLMMFDTLPEWPDTPSFLSVYVRNADEVFTRAVAAGAEIITEIATVGILGDRVGRVRDPLGNIWWISTHLEDVDLETAGERFQDPDQFAAMDRLQQTFQDEMWRRTREQQQASGPTNAGTPTNADAATNMVTWFQLPADDTARAWTFYGEVFGWSPEAAYSNPPLPGAIHGEVAARDQHLPHPRPVVRVDDLADTLERIRKAGGEVLNPRTEIPEIDMVYAVFADTEGNLVNLVGDLAPAA